jgi:hypothetical protein
MIILDFFRGRFNRGATGFRVSWRLIYSGPIRREGISTQSPSDGPSAKLGFSGLAASNTLAGQNQPRQRAYGCIELGFGHWRLHARGYIFCALHHKRS